MFSQVEENEFMKEIHPTFSKCCTSIRFALPLEIGQEARKQRYNVELHKRTKKEQAEALKKKEAMAEEEEAQAEEEEEEAEASYLEK
jgi:methyl coenzyme M reductase alpha subunit